MATVEGFQGSDRVIERNNTVAQEHAERRALKMAHVLIKYVGDEGPIPRAGYRRILARERAEVSARFLVDRESGRVNDRESTSKGLTALVIEGTEAFFTSDEVKENLQGGFSLEQVGQIDDLQLDALSLPEGFFEQTSGGIRFSVRGQVDLIGVLGEMKDSFMIDRQNVVRIIGYDGDFWQNTRYNADGTPMSTPQDDNQLETIPEA